MKAALISQGSVSSQWTYEEMKKLFPEVDLIDLKKVEIKLGGKEAKILYDGKPIKSYDCVYVKGSFRYQTIQRSITSLLYQSCFMPIKASAFSVAHNKLLSQLKFQTAGVPMPETYLTSSIDASENVLKSISYPIIMKFLEGTQGKGVVFADSFESASSILDALTSLNQPFIIQEYVETGATDLRIIVVGNEVIAAMQRKGKSGEKRANMHKGGQGIAIQVDEVTRRVAINAARSVGAEICGVDILEGSKGPVVLEINISPGLQGITQVTGINVAKKIAEYLYKKTKERHDKTSADHTKEIYDSLEIHNVDNILSTVQFRGQRILLPEFVSKVTRFNEEDEVTIKAEKGRVCVEKQM